MGWDRRRSFPKADRQHKFHVFGRISLYIYTCSGGVKGRSYNIPCATSRIMPIRPTECTVPTGVLFSRAWSTYKERKAQRHQLNSTYPYSPLTNLTAHSPHKGTPLAPCALKKFWPTLVPVGIVGDSQLL